MFLSPLPQTSTSSVTHTRARDPIFFPPPNPHAQYLVIQSCGPPLAKLSTLPALFHHPAPPCPGTPHTECRKQQTFLFSWFGRLRSPSSRLWQGLVSGEDSLAFRWPPSRVLTAGEGERGSVSCYTHHRSNARRDHCCQLATCSMSKSLCRGRDGTVPQAICVLPS